MPATCRYSDMVATPSSVATRRIVTAGDPSASAIAMAVRTTSSRVTSGWVVRAVT